MKSMGKVFEVRQRCPLSPLLFNVMIGDIEEALGRDKVGGVENREREIKRIEVCGRFSNFGGRREYEMVIEEVGEIRRN